MPLIHSKRPEAFKHNVETEMSAGKPQKQAVAIAYEEAGEAHKAEGGEVGGTDVPSEEDEISSALGSELMGALEAKDHKKIMSAIEATVLRCMNKGQE